ncbi:MAG: DUF1565 domain-containing protein [Myxococcota bacterium]
MSLHPHRRWTCLVASALLAACGGDAREDADGATGVDSAIGTDADTTTSNADTDVAAADVDRADSDGGDLTASAVIGPAGCELRSTDGRMTITVPPGAVDVDTPFTITVDDDALAEVRLGPAYRLGPDDVDFHAAVVATLDYGAVDLGGEDESDLTLLVYDDALGHWLGATPSVLYTAAHSVSSERWHFSVYAVGARAKAISRLSSLPVVRFAIGPTLFVASDGDDEATGERDFPFRTLEKAESVAAEGRWRLQISDAQVLILDYSGVTTVELGAGTFAAHGNNLGLRGKSSDETHLTGIVWAGYPGRTFERFSATAILVQQSAVLQDLRVTVRGDGTPGITVLPVASLTATMTRVEVVGPGDTESVGISSEGSARVEIASSNIHGCGIGVHLLQRATDGFPGSSRITGTTLTQNAEGIHVEDGVADVDLAGNTITGNHVGLRVGAAGVTMHAPGGNILSCNTVYDVDATSALNASKNRWDHVPPERFAIDVDPTFNDYVGPVTTAGATLAPNPCARPKGRCAVSEPPAAVILYGDSQECTKGLGGEITCGALPTPRCEARIPDPATASECPDPSASLVPEPIATDPTAPATMSVDGATNGCTATLGGEPPTYTTTSQNGGRGLQPSDACALTVGDATLSVSAPGAFGVGADDPIGVAAGLDTVVTVADDPDAELMIDLALGPVGGGPDDAPTASILETLDFPTLTELAGGKRSAPLASAAVRTAIAAAGLEPRSADVCVTHSGEAADALASGAPLTLACGRCVHLDQQDLTACGEEICDGQDNDCDGSTDEGCPVSFKSNSAPFIFSDVFGAQNPLNTGASNLVCPYPTVLTGIAGWHKGAGVIRMSYYYCGAFSIVEDKSVVPYAYALTVATTLAADADSSWIGVGTGTTELRPCPTDMVVDHMLGKAGSDLGQLQAECVKLELQRGAGNVWTVVRGATSSLEPIGAGDGPAFDFAVPAGSGGLPGFVTRLDFRNDGIHPIANMKFGGSTGPLVVR